MPEPFVAPSQSVFFEMHGYRCHMAIGGPDLIMPLANGKTQLFELHNYFGPIPLNKRTGESISRIPKAFWDAWELWDRSGKLIQGNVCVLPNKCPLCNGLGFEVEMLDSRNGVIGDECLLCEGKKFVWPDHVAPLP